MEFRRAFEGAYTLHYAESKVHANFHSPFVLGGEYKNCLFISQNGRLSGYYSACEMARLRLVSYALLMNKDYAEKLMDESRKACNGIVQITRLIAGEDLSLLSNRELAFRLGLFRREHWLNQAYFLSSMPTCTFLLEKNLEEFISKKVKDKKKRQEYTIALTTPAEKTALNREEEEYSELLLDMISSTNLPAPMTFPKFRKYLLKDRPDTLKRIHCLLDRYQWIPTQERNPPYDTDHYLRMLYNDLKRPNDESVEESRFHKRKFRQFERNRKRVESLLRLPKRMKYLVKMVRDLAHMRMELRLARTESDFLGGTLRGEVGKRLGINAYDVEFLTADELVDALLHKRKICAGAIKERRGYYVWEVREGVGKILTGKEAKAQGAEYAVNEKNAGKGRIVGLAASPGKVRGIVRIISPLSHRQSKDCENMKKGEILVTGQTRPHLMVAVRKALAIVTDEGGMSSHSALVSREYKIPCIVGTHNATKMLSNGDLIEVDAYSGTVNIISKKRKAR